MVKFSVYLNRLVFVMRSLDMMQTFYQGGTEGKKMDAGEEETPVFML